jgi:hypothetical protein
MLLIVSRDSRSWVVAEKNQDRKSPDGKVCPIGLPDILTTIHLRDGLLKRETVILV